MAGVAIRLNMPAEVRSAVVVSVPHSGRAYPPEFLRRSALSALAIRSSEDAWVDLLAAAAPRLGMAMLVAEYPRAWVDLNRAAEDLDPALIEGVPRGTMNPRVLSGLGVIPRVVAGGRAIQSGKISRAEAEARIEVGWRPYHAALVTQMDVTLRRFGQAVLLDLHSMPRESSGRRADIVLGDRHGSSASAHVTAAVEAAFGAEGFSVARNAPFAGAYICKTYGRPAEGRHAVQIEIDRSLYMDEATLIPHRGFAEVQAALGRALARVTGLGSAGLAEAAE